MRKTTIGDIKLYVSDHPLAVNFSGDLETDFQEMYRFAVPNEITIIQGVHVPGWDHRGAFVSAIGSKKVIYSHHYPLDSFVILHELGHIFAPQKYGDERNTQHGKIYNETHADAWAIERANYDQVVEGYLDLRRLIKEKKDAGKQTPVGDIRLLQFEAYFRGRKE